MLIKKKKIEEVKELDDRKQGEVAGGRVSTIPNGIYRVCNNETNEWVGYFHNKSEAQELDEKVNGQVNH